MQTDMHYYGTYAIARVAGIPERDANIIAYSAQFVDDSSQRDSELHDDEGMMWGIATAHHAKDCVVNAHINSSEQRRVWVPFHFLPGGQGETLEQKLICTKDSKIVNDLFDNHIHVALSGKDFGLHLLGIVSHVYMDTFSHYGFSGISSDYNSIINDSIEFITRVDKKTKRYILKKAKRFWEKYTNPFVSLIGETASRSLGHGAVKTYPDRPYLHWTFEYECSQPGNGVFSNRNNPKTFLEGCEKLYSKLSHFAQQHYEGSNNTIPFKDVRDQVVEILQYQGGKKERIKKWRRFIQSHFSKPVKYSHLTWEDQREEFTKTASSSENINLDIYRFHQAATYHRYFVLKDLLPANEIMAY